MNHTIDPIDVLLVDDQDLVRTGFRIILDTAPDLRVVGEARDGLEAVDLTRRLRPDVVVMDIEMPVLDGLEATRRILEQSATDGPAVLVLTTFGRDDYVFRALRAGASGFLLKTATPEELIEAIAVVHRGDALLSPQLTRAVVERAVGGDAAARVVVPGPALATLTEREREVLDLICQDMDDAAIAERLELSRNTVRNHVARLYAKIGVNRRSAAIVWAHERGVGA